MRTKTIGIIALMLVVIFSSEAVFANEFAGNNDEFYEPLVTKINEFAENDKEFVEPLVAKAIEFEENDDEFDEPFVAHKQKCTKKSETYIEARCITSKCITSCINEGHAKGKCMETKDDKIKSCYCFVQCKTPIAPSPSSPVVVQPPSASPTDGPVQVSPVHPPWSPASPPEGFPSVEPQNGQADAPEQVSPVYPPSSAADSPTSDERERFWTEEGYNEFY